MSNGIVYSWELQVAYLTTIIHDGRCERSEVEFKSDYEEDLASWVLISLQISNLLRSRLKGSGDKIASVLLLLLQL